MNTSEMSDGMRKFLAIAGMICLVIGVLAFVAFFLRDLMQVDIGYRGNLVPLTMLMVVGGGLLMSAGKRAG